MKEKKMSWADFFRAYAILQKEKDKYKDMVLWVTPKGLVYMPKGEKPKP